MRLFTLHTTLTSTYTPVDCIPKFGNQTWQQNTQKQFTRCQNSRPQQIATSEV